ncbi:hypothetical protein [Homoserinimonas hongtaonis]|uniref:hypothetical protein n=1 Tax=Homoserinimonas hongtaonis TaxID=2079791 RepID=UPI00131F35D8|nr:hypothetical protein [Salinibacterium hongtaonis]
MSASPRRRATAIVIAVLGVAVLVGAIVAVTWWMRGSSSDGASPAETPAVDTAYVLDRADPADGGDDAIVRVALDGPDGSEEPVFSAPHIIDFAVAASDLVVLTGVPDGAGVVSEHSLEIVSAAGGSPRPVELPGAGTIDLLSASESGLVGFTFTSAGDPLDREYAATLMWFDPQSDAAPQVVEGEGGAPIETAAWLWSGDATMLAVGSDEELVLLDPVDNAVLESFGEWEGLEAVASDGLTAIVRDHHDTVLLGLSDASSESREGTPFGPTPLDERSVFGGSVQFLGDGPERIHKIGVVDPESGRVDSMIVLDDGATPRVLYAAAEGEGIDGFSVSPDGQLVAVEVVPNVAAMVSDAYYPYARATSIVTRFVDVATGEVVRETPGFGVEWAR